MAKTTVNNLVSMIKRLWDYNITDSDTDTLILDAVNLSLKVLKQWFAGAELYDEISDSDNFNTTANQAYIDIATETTDLDEILRVYERTNDTIIELIPYSEFVALYPDPTADTSTTPNYAARWNNRLYLGPTPSATGTAIYIEYIKLISNVSAGETLPFEQKYDPLLVAMAIEWLQRWKFTDEASPAITQAKDNVMELKYNLIDNATNNIGVVRQIMSRRGKHFWGPRKVVN